jgi:hypothetical protein
MRGRLAQHHGRLAKAPGRDARTNRSARPYGLIVSDHPCKTLAQGDVRHYARLLDACNAFAKAPEPYKQIIFDDGCTARELNRNEQWMLESVCRILGFGIEEVGA